MNWKNILIVCSIGVFICFIGCEQFLSPIGSEINPDANRNEKNIIGKKLENPYTVESMLRAKDSLEKKGIITKGILKDDDFIPTHYYICFKPKTVEEYLYINQNSNLTLWDIPLDYNFPEGKIDYRDPEIPDGKPNYLYTAVKINQELPSQNYEILAELILSPESDEMSLSKRNNFFSFYDQLEQEALRITGNQSTIQKGCAKTLGTWRPTGSIQVFDNVLSRNVPVITVNVRVKNWFKWWDGYTDGNGNFRCSKTFYGDVAYSLRWQYIDNKFDIRSGSLGQAYYNGPNNKRSAWNLVISSGMSWVYAHIYRAGSYYIGLEPFGLSNTPFKRISICTYDENAPSTESGHYNNFNENVIMYKKNSSGNPYTSQELFSIAAHELGHAHHDEIYTGGSVYTNVSHRLKESWAVAVSYFMTSNNYSLPLTDHSLNWYTYQSFVRSSDSYYTPLIIDLIDTYDQHTKKSSYLTDYISGYTLPQIETILAKGGCKSVNDFKNEIKALPLPTGITNTLLDDYFNQFDGTAPPTYNSTTLNGGYSFTKGHYIFSPNNRFILVWQTDGNLVLYDTYNSPARGVWSSQTWGRETTHCIMQTDGNLVIYNLNNPANGYNVWCSATWGNTNAILHIEDNGRVAIYNSSKTKELWSSTNDNSMLF